MKSFSDAIPCKWHNWQSYPTSVCGDWPPICRCDENAFGEVGDGIDSTSKAVECKSSDVKGEELLKLDDEGLHVRPKRMS